MTFLNGNMGAQPGANHTAYTQYCAHGPIDLAIPGKNDQGDGGKEEDNGQLDSIPVNQIDILP